jgi:hypothetical protein
MYISDSVFVTLVVLSSLSHLWLSASAELEVSYFTLSASRRKAFAQDVDVACIFQVIKSLSIRSFLMLFYTDLSPGQTKYWYSQSQITLSKDLCIL